jgi:coatomer subunit beta
MSHSANQNEKPCTIYVDTGEQEPPSQQDIQKGLSSTKIEDKIKSIKSLIVAMIHDESYPRMMMNVINSVLPVQNDSHGLKKILLYYWEVK